MSRPLWQTTLRGLVEGLAHGPVVLTVTVPEEAAATLMSLETTIDAQAGMAEVLGIDMGCEMMHDGDKRSTLTLEISPRPDFAAGQVLEMMDMLDVKNGWEDDA